MAAHPAKPLFTPHAAFFPASAAVTVPVATTRDLAAGPDSDDARPVVVFRLLLPRAFSDGDAIRLYAAIAPLRRRTPALQVRVEALGAGASDDGDGDGGGYAGGRVAVVLGPASPARRVEVSSSSSSVGEPLLLSPAQEALVALLESGGALHVDERRGPEVMTCMFLVEADQLEAAFGRGILVAIATEAGAEVRVAPWEEDAPPPRTHTPEEIIEITGGRTMVRKAIVAVSSRLQGYLPATGSTTSVETASPMPPWRSSETPQPNLGTLHSEPSTEYAVSNIPQIDCPQLVKGDAQTNDLQQISFRLLCHVSLAGGLIGTKGLVIKHIEDQTGASIDVSAPISGCMERVITISALESPQPQSSIVQNALLRVFDRMNETNAHLMLDNPAQCSARVLVLKRQVCVFVGFGGAVIKEIMNSTSARIQLLDETDVPACASHHEQVLQITGSPLNVRDALCLVSIKLQNHAFSLDTAHSTADNQVNISSTGHYTTDNVPTVDHGSSLNEMDSAESSFHALHLQYPIPSELEQPASGNGSGINVANNEMQKPARSGVGFNNSNDWVQKPPVENSDGMKNSNHQITSLEEKKPVREIYTATIVRITYEVAACGSVLYLLYGNNGTNLAKLRETSGADISIYDPPPETSNVKIIISGTPDQTQSAMAMLIDLTRQHQ